MRCRRTRRRSRCCGITSEAAGEILSRLDAALVDLADLDPSCLDAPELVDGISRLLDIETGLRTVQASWLATAQGTDAVVDETGRAVRSWLVEDLHLAPAEAGRRIRLAHDLSNRPGLAAALRNATITLDQAGAIRQATRAVGAEHLDAAEAALAEVARTGTLLDVNRAVDEVLTRTTGETDLNAPNVGTVSVHWISIPPPAEPAGLPAR